jgi:hypothetical protein
VNRLVAREHQLQFLVRIKACAGRKTVRVISAASIGSTKTRSALGSPRSCWAHADKTRGSFAYRLPWVKRT